MSRRRIRVLIVDDHRVFAASLARALGDEEDLEVVGAVSTAADALDACRLGVDVVVCDYRLAETDGIALTADLRAAFPGIQVVMLTAYTADSVLVDALQAGVAGFLDKSGPLDEVIASLRAAGSGDSLLTPAIMTRLIPQIRRRGDGPKPDLSARELEVLVLMGLGLSNQGIADKLFLSRDTVRNHVARILRKLGAHSKLEAVAVAAQRGLIRPGVR